MENKSVENILRFSGGLVAGVIGGLATGRLGHAIVEGGAPVVGGLSGPIIAAFMTDLGVHLDRPEATGYLIGHEGIVAAMMYIGHRNDPTRLR